MQTIVAPTDFSPASQNAVNYAADWALVTGAKLSLLHVYPIPLSFSEVPAPAYSLKELESDANERIQKIKEDVIDRTGGRLVVDIALRQGDVLMGIEDYCELVHPFAVVMGAENAKAAERFLFGGRTTAAVRKLSWPVIIVPPDARFASIRKIGLACDFKNVVETIPFMEIKALIKEFNAELHVLHASEGSSDAFSPETIEESGWLQDILGELNPKYHFIKNEEPEIAINEFAEKNNIDLLIVVPKKHNLIARIFKHSHSKRLVLHAHVPVMTVHE
jgi:nucleotide-binding universal stress UspA family protein